MVKRNFANCEVSLERFVQIEHFTAHLSKSTSTRITSIPICLTSHTLMTYSTSRPSIPHILQGPGTIRWVILPVQISNCISQTHPIFMQSRQFITSFCRMSQIRMRYPLSYGNIHLNLLYAQIFHEIHFMYMIIYIIVFKLIRRFLCC